MDILTFIVELIKSLAWPVAAVIIAALFRAELRGLMKRIKKGKVGPAEFEFEEKVAALNYEATIEGRTREIPIDSELVSQAVHNPRGAIVSAWLNVEESARDLALTKELLSEKMARSPVSVIRAIKDAGLLDLRFVGLMNSLRELRNRAAHDGDFMPEPQSVIDYVRLATELTKALNDAASSPNK